MAVHLCSGKGKKGAHFQEESADLGEMMLMHCEPVVSEGPGPTDTSAEG